MERLNPGRVFRIAIPVHERSSRTGSASCTPADRARLDDDRRLELVNPLAADATLADVSCRRASARARRSRRAHRHARRAVEPDDAAPGSTRSPRLHCAPRARRRRPLSGQGRRRRVRRADRDLSGRHRRRVHDRGAARAIPQYPTPGPARAHDPPALARRRPHPDRRLVQLLAVAAVHARRHRRCTTRFHTPWWKMGRRDATFLPAAWRVGDAAAATAGRSSSSGCSRAGRCRTAAPHVNTGHIAELRQILPAETERALRRRRLPQRSSEHYDVFDIDGDLTPEVMGVRYFIAYSLIAGKPDRLRVRTSAAPTTTGSTAATSPTTRRPRRLPRRPRRALRRPATPRGPELRPRRRCARPTTSPRRVQFYRMVDIPFAARSARWAVHHSAPELLDRRRVGERAGHARDAPNAMPRASQPARRAAQ